MKTIVVIRHAKSDWDSPSGDFYRPLASRGITDAARVAQEALPFLPESYTVWSSSAARASATAMIFAKHFGLAPGDIDFKDELYTFDGREFERIIKACDNRHDALIVFGHNEAITDFVNKFGDILIDDVPTAGFVTLTFATDDWKNIGKGKTGKVIFPRDLRP